MAHTQTDSDDVALYRDLGQAHRGIAVRPEGGSEGDWMSAARPGEQAAVHTDERGDGIVHSPPSDSDMSLAGGALEGTAVRDQQRSPLSLVTPVTCRLPTPELASTWTLSGDACHGDLEAGGEQKPTIMSSRKLGTAVAYSSPPAADTSPSWMRKARAFKSQAAASPSDSEMSACKTVQRQPRNVCKASPSQGYEHRQRVQGSTGRLEWPPLCEASHRGAIPVCPPGGADAGAAATSPCQRSHVHTPAVKLFDVGTKEPGSASDPFEPAMMPGLANGECAWPSFGQAARATVGPGGGDKSEAASCGGLPSLDVSKHGALAQFPADTVNAVHANTRHTHNTDDCGLIPFPPPTLALPSDNLPASGCTVRQMDVGGRRWMWRAPGLMPADVWGFS